MEQLSDIKAKSIVEWIAVDRVRRSIVRHFRQFLMTYIDENGSSVYGQRIRNLGESMYTFFSVCIFFFDTHDQITQQILNPLKYHMHILLHRNPFWHIS